MERTNVRDIISYQSMGLLQHPFVSSAADGRHVPERDDALSHNFVADYDEDVTRLWISIAIFGVIVCVSSTLVVLQLLQPTGIGWGDLVPQLVIDGIAVVFLGSFAAYLAYPAAMGWVALAGALIMAQGIILGLWGTQDLWVAVGVFLVLGLACIGVGAWRSVVSWNTLRREEEEPSPS